MRLWPRPKRIAHRVVFSGILLLGAREQALPSAMENDLVVDICRIHNQLDTEAEVVLHDAANYIP